MSTKIICVWHPGEAKVHHIQTQVDVGIAELHDALMRQGYAHPHPKIVASMLNSPSHAGRGIHVVHRDGFYVDGENISRDDSRPVPHGATFGHAIKRDDSATADYNGKAINATDSRVAAALAADAE